MNIFYLQLNPNGNPKGWLIPMPPIDFPDDLIKYYYGKDLTHDWNEYGLKREVVERVLNSYVGE